MTASAVAAPGRREQADALVAREYELRKAEVLRTVRGRLAARGMRFDDSDLESFYNQAWHGVHLRLSEGGTVENPVGLLVTISERRAVDELRSLRPERRAAAGEADDRLVDPDLAGRLDDHTRLRRFVEGLRSDLSERERQAAALCYVQDFTRAEAAAALGVTPRRMEKIMDRVSKKVGALVRDIAQDEWCERRRSTIKAYSLGMLDASGERHRQAVEHLDDCSACRYRVLRWRGLAALVPPVPALPFLTGGGTGAGRRPRRPRSRQLAAGAGATAAVAAAAIAFAATGDRDAPEPVRPAAASAGTPAPTVTVAPADNEPRSTQQRSDVGEARLKAKRREAARRRAAAKRRQAQARRAAERRQAPAQRTPPQPSPPAASPSQPQPPSSPPPRSTPAAPVATATPPAATAPTEPPLDRDGAGEFELR